MSSQRNIHPTVSRSLLPLDDDDDDLHEKMKKNDNHEVDDTKHTVKAEGSIFLSEVKTVRRQRQQPTLPNNGTLHKRRLDHDVKDESSSFVSKSTSQPPPNNHKSTSPSSARQTSSTLSFLLLPQNKSTNDKQNGVKNNTPFALEHQTPSPNEKRRPLIVEVSPTSSSPKSTQPSHVPSSHEHTHDDDDPNKRFSAKSMTDDHAASSSVSLPLMEHMSLSQQIQMEPVRHPPAITKKERSIMASHPHSPGDPSIGLSEIIRQPTLLDLQSGPSSRKETTVRSDPVFWNALSRLLLRLEHYKQPISTRQHQDHAEDHVAMIVKFLQTHRMGTMVVAPEQEAVRQNRRTMVWDSILEPAASHVHQLQSHSFITTTAPTLTLTTAPSPSSTSTLIQLGIQILWHAHDWNSLEVYLENIRLDDNSAGKRSRIQMLGACVIVWSFLQTLKRDCCYRNNDDDKDGDNGIKRHPNATEKENISVTIALQNLLTCILPKLVQIMTTDNNNNMNKNNCDGDTTPKRTVLHALCMDVCLEIWQVTAFYCTVSSKDETQKSLPASEIDDSHNRKMNRLLALERLYLQLWGTLEHLKHLLHVKQQWLSHSGGDSNTNDDANDSATRRACTVAVIADWNKLILTSERNLGQLVCDAGLEPNKAKWSASQLLCYHLAGLQETIQDTNHEMYSLEIGTGGISQTLTSIRNKDKDRKSGSSAKRWFWTLSLAHECLQAQRDENTSQVLTTSSTMQRTILRCILSWLGQNKKHLRQLAKTKGSDGSTSTLLDQSTMMTMSLLRSQSEPCLDLVLPTLFHLWSSSGGLPPDIFEFDSSDDTSDTATIPASFEHLLMAVRESSASRDTHAATSCLDSSTRVMCELLSRFILSRSKPFLRALVSQNGMHRDSTIEILIMVLRRIQIKNGINDTGVNSLNGSVSELLLDAIESSSYLRKKLRFPADNMLFSKTALPQLVPRLMGILHKLSSPMKSTKTSEDVLSTATKLLTKVVEDRVIVEGDDLISLLLESIESMLKECKTEAENEKLSNRVCSRIGGAWRRSLLENPSNNDSVFARLLEALARAMFRMPSESVPLTLFGATVGEVPDLNNTETNGSSARSVKRTVAATLGLLRIGVEKLQLVSSVNSTDVDDDAIFKRLSPLLMLRRIPPFYFQCTHEVFTKAHSEDSVNVMQELEEMNGNLVKQICCRLDIKTESSQTLKHVQFTAEERRLSAEIAGRCLPFFQLPTLHDAVMECKSNAPISLFHGICLPAFSTLLRQLSKEAKFVSTIQLEPGNDIYFKQARAALFAVCQNIPMAKNDSNTGLGLLATVAFVLRILQFEATHGNDAHESTISHAHDDDLIQLQTGCIDFLAICVESLVLRKANNKPEETSASHQPFIEEIIISQDDLPLKEKAAPPKQCLKNAFSALSYTFTTILTIITNGCIPYSKLEEGDRFIVSGTTLDQQAELLSRPDDTMIPFSPTARTCLLNGLVLASQRCPMEHNQLQILSSSIVPKLLDWGGGDPTSTVRNDIVDTQLRHPLCVAAALQVCFILVTRNKSFHFGSSCAPDQEVSKYIRKANTWALAAVQGQAGDDGGSSSNTRISKQCGAYAMGAMRMSGLKFLLAIVSIDQWDNDPNPYNNSPRLEVCLSPGELAHTFSVLQGAANMDSDPNVRKLAVHILSAMRP